MPPSRAPAFQGREYSQDNMTMSDTSQSQPILLRGARVVNPARALDGPGAVLIADGRILACGMAASARSGAALGPDVTRALAQLDAQGRPARVIDLPVGWVIAPGFVDLHAHLREPG